MSKKNLAKSAIEGGRNNHNKYERRSSHAEERNAAKEFCKQIIIDPESADDLDLIEKKTKVYKEFTDKLNPMYRWLRAQVGRVWDEVRSEVFKKFDIRTTAGRHILFDHLLKSVETESTPYPYYFRWENYPDNGQSSYHQNDFYVDTDGLLQERNYISRRARRGSNINTRWIAQWLNGRIVGRVGDKLYWFVPSIKDGWVDEWKCQWEPGLRLIYLRREYQSVVNNMYGKSTFKPAWVEPTYFITKNISTQRDSEFSEDDYEVWEQIPLYYQKLILEYSTAIN